MKKIYFVLFAILCTIIFACTDNLISTELISNQNSSTGELKVYVKQSRLYSPVISEISWTVELVDEEKNTYSSKEIGSYYLFSGLQSGIYSVTASGKDSSGIERFAGEITFNFDSEKQLEIHVPVSASKNSSDITSTGFATITMEMSEELLGLISINYEEPYLYANLSQRIDYGDNIFEVTLVQPNEEPGTITILNNQKVDFVDYKNNDNPTSIPVGYYNLTFSGLGDYSIKLKDNLVEIGAGLTTNIVLTQNDYEIVENYSSILYVNNEGGETADGKTLSNPIAFSTITENNYADLIYLLSDVEFIYDENSNLSPYLDSISGTISSFGSTVRTISSPEGTTGQLPSCTLKNVKLSGSFSNIENNLYITIEDTVILDCKMASNKPIVYLSKSSNLVVGKNFSGNLYLSLSQENWQLGDTVINFENGKPENSNFYIEENCCNSEFQNYSSMFYIDDSGKLAKYTDDFTSFAWTGDIPSSPCLVTKTQAKNKTYTSINTISPYDSFTGISTYDGDKTWYFVCYNSENQYYSLYSVAYSDVYTNTVIASKLITTSLNDNFSLGQVRVMSYDDGKLYFGIYTNGTIDVYYIDINSTSVDYLSFFTPSMENANISDLSALFVKGNDFYFATTYTDNNQASNSSITHSAIWKCELTKEDTGGYTLSPESAVPYYLTQNDKSLTITDDLSDYSNLPAPTFRVTDLYSDGNSVYGLLANYIETHVNINANNIVYMRGSVFKLEENASTVNAIHYGLRKDSLQISDIQTAKQSFILPRKIVGIVNKKLIIADDGMIPDKTDCNLDRFILFDLDGSISEKIDVDVSFTTSGFTSGFATNTLF